MIALVIFLIIVVIVVTTLKKSPTTNPATAKILGAVRMVALLAIILSAVFSAVVQVGPGEVGVQVLFGSVQQGTLHSGLNFVNPLVTVEKMDIKTQAYTMSSTKDEGMVKGDDAIATLSSDGLTLKLDLTVWYRLSEGD